MGIFCYNHFKRVHENPPIRTFDKQKPKGRFKHMKKLCLMLLVASLLVTSVVPAMADLVNAAFLPSCYRYVTAGEAVMYKSSDMPAFASSNASSTVIGRVTSGERVNVLTLSTYRDWAFIVTASLPGGAWVPSNMLLNTSVLGCNAVVVASASGNRVNLREAPDSKAATMGKYYTGTLVTVLEEPVAGTGYCRVRIGSTEGYMDSAYLLRSLTNSWQELPTLYAASWSNTQHPLHQEPNGYAPVVGYVPNSSAVTVLGIRNDGWYHVMYQGMTGYIRTSAFYETLPWDLYETDDSSTSGGVKDPAEVIIDELLGSRNHMFVLSSREGRKVNLRRNPDGSSTVLIQYYTGTPVYVIDGGENGYLHVRIGYMEGYMDVNFLRSDSRGRETDMHGSLVNSVLGYGCVYQWNEEGSPVEDVLPNGTTVVVLGYSAGWAHIVYGDMQYGYMLCDDLYPEP